MSPKEKFLQTLACDNAPGLVPWWELEFHLWGHYTKKRVIVGEEFLKLSKREKEYAVWENADGMAEAAGEIGFSAISIPGGYWELAPGKAAYYWLPEKYREMQVKALKGVVKDNIALVANTGGIMAIPEANRYVDFASRMFDHPEEIEREAKWLLETSKVHIMNFRNLGVEVFLSASDLADNSGPFFPPEQFKRFILPCLEEWSEFIGSKDAYSILHSDGNLDMYTDLIADTPLHALQAIDPLSGMNILETKKKVGDRLCLCGNLDCGAVLTSRPEEIISIAGRLLQDLHPYSGYVFGMSNVLEADTPPEKFEAVRQAYQQCLNKE